MAGHFAGDIGGMFRRVERGGIRPDEPEPVADFFIGKIGEPDAKRAWVGKRQIGFAGLREIRVNLERVADIHDDDERRVVIGNGADVSLGLTARLHHRIVPGTGAAHGLGRFFPADNPGFLGSQFKLRRGGLGFLKLFGFEDETGAFVEVYAAIAGGAVRVLLNDRKLEKIAVGWLRVGVWHTEQIAKAKQAWLRVPAAY